MLSVLGTGSLFAIIFRDVGGLGVCVCVFFGFFFYSYKISCLFLSVGLTHRGNLICSSTETSAVRWRDKFLRELLVSLVNIKDEKFCILFVRMLHAEFSCMRQLLRQ